jgi:molybdate transport system regulatory protein
MTSKAMKKPRSISGARANSKSVRPRFKVWLEANDGYVLGEGRVALLHAIQRTGSLNRAAADMRMSYRAAWGSIRTMEKRLGIPLLETSRGGEHGGGSQLTPEAEQLVLGFDVCTQRLHTLVEEIFSEFRGCIP